MSSDSHIKFDGVDGEATHKDHKGEIAVLSWAWNVAQPSGASSGGGSGKGKAIAGDFNFTHLFDKASPVLAKSCVKGTHFKSVKLTSRKAGDGQKDFLVVTMKEAMVTSLAPAGSSGGDVMENVSFSFKDIEIVYKPQDDKGGLGGDVKFGWDTATTDTR
jgi:type VI secretion system secreted protein Hcp